MSPSLNSKVIFLKAMVADKTLSDLMVEEPSASCAVICKTPEMAEPCQKLKDIPKTRLVLDGDFDFTPGIDIQSKSGERFAFDYVIASRC